jgi:predicted Zn-dependent peptidase
MSEGYSSLEERAERYAEITPENIRGAAHTLFDSDNMTVAVKGNKKRIDLSKIDALILDYKNKF